jgi:hypothetical protein
MRPFAICAANILAGLFGLAAFFLPSAAEAQTQGGANQAALLRSFNDLFPNIGEERRREAFSAEGIVRYLGRNESPQLIPAPDSGIDLRGAVMRTNPSYLAESLLVVPYSGRILTKLDAYNATGRIRELKGRLYHSYTRSAEVALFEDATRLESASRNNPIPDPPPAMTLPPSETIYIRLKDVNFGNSYYRAEVSATSHGIIYNLTNYRSLSYLIFTVMREEKFSAILYMEPLAEGMLVYSMAGADASDFIANRIDIPSAIGKRLAVFIGWIGDALRAMR